MHIGDTLADRFVIEHLAGRGGMGAVYRALDRSTGQPVAVKVLHVPQSRPVARFEREARILAELKHPQIVRYIAHGAASSGEPYLVMEWLDGEDLSGRLARGRLGMADSVGLALSVAGALSALHERGIVHRDLKPGNIFLVEGRIDQAKLLDFGLVRLTEGTRMTDSGKLLGTVAYMAPEQARGDQGMDGRADIFALGCVLFECLTGQPAFSAHNITAILVKLLFEEPPRLRDRLPAAPAALDELVSRMLIKHPAERPRDVREVTKALRELLDKGLIELNSAPTLELPRPLISPREVGEGPTIDLPLSGLTDSEQRAAAVILLSAPAPAQEREREPDGAEPDVDAPLAREAAAHSGAFERLMDGSAAVLLSGARVATDLAAHAARCALALSRHAAGRQIVLAMGQSGMAGHLPVGPAIERAARLLASQSAPAQGGRPARITLDEATLGLLDARFDVREKSGVFELVGERDLAEARTLLGKPTPCVGRERELRVLDQLFEASAEEATAHAVLVTAPPGVGKSRLAHEFLQKLRARPGAVAIWMGRGDSLRAGSALGILGQALRSACGVREGDPIEARRDKVRAAVAERIAPSEQARVAEFLGELIGTPFPDADSLPLRAARGDAQLMTEQMQVAFLDFLLAQCARNPLVIVLDDLHWGDRPTVQFIDRALRDLSEQPLFVLALARPEVHELFPSLWAKRASQEIRLRELSKKAIEVLVHHVLGDRDRAGPHTSVTTERLVELSEGNAFYLEELIRWAAEARGSDLPETVVAMVQSRLGALDPGARRLLRAASVFGGVFWTGGVRALVGGDSGERTMSVRYDLAALVERELCVRRAQSRFPGEEEYAFRHALLREGAYAMLTDEDRALGHRLAGQWLEAHGEQDALMLAEHFEKGGDGSQAGRYYLRAAEKVSWAGDSLTAIAYAQRGLACNVSGELRIALLGALCEMHFFQVELVTAALPHAQALLAMAPPASAPWIQGMLIVLNCAMQAGQIDDVMATLRNLLATDPAQDAAGTLALAVASGIALLNQLGKIAEADAALDRLTELVRRLGDRVPLAPMWWHLISGVQMACTKEDPASGLMHSEAARAIADATGHRRYRGIAHILAGANQWFLGAAASAERALKELNMPDQEMGHVASLRPFVLAWLLADRGAWGEARAWASGLIASGEARRRVLHQGRGHWALAEVLRREGELAAAETEIEAALAMLNKTSPLDQPGVLATLAALRLGQGRVAEALAAAEEGLSKYESMGACSYFFRGAFLRLVHAECLEANGLRDAACAAIARARHCILTNAEKISDTVYRKSFLEDVPENQRTIALASSWLGERSA